MEQKATATRMGSRGGRPLTCEGEGKLTERVTLFLSPRQLAALEAMSDGRPIAQFVRERLFPATGGTDGARAA